MRETDLSQFRGLDEIVMIRVVHANTWVPDQLSRGSNPASASRQLVALDMLLISLSLSFLVSKKIGTPKQGIWKNHFFIIVGSVLLIVLCNHRKCFVTDVSRVDKAPTRMMPLPSEPLLCQGLGGTVHSTVQNPIPSPKVPVSRRRAAPNNAMGHVPS